MSQPALARMDADTFLEWRQDQPGRWELVDGWPVQAMAGAKQRHDRIVVNLIISLGNRLSGGPCFPQTDDVAARMLNGNLRQPDVTVDCGPVQPDELTSTSPTAFFEVLSPSTRSLDLIVKSEEYKRVATLRHIVMIDPRLPKIWTWSRVADGDWQGELVEGLNTDLQLPGISVSLPLADIYKSVPLDPA